MAGRAGWRIAALLLLAALALAVAACGGDEVGAEPAVAGEDATKIKATLAHADAGEYTFTLDKNSAPAGQVVFEIENVGELEHEFEVVKTDAAADSLPVEGEKANVEAGGGEEIGEVEDIAPGAKTEFAADLEPGKYLIVCNLPGHYGQGMVIPFTVK